MVQQLVTDRLRLEPLTETHASALFGILQADEIYDHLDESPPSDVDVLRSRYRKLEARESPDGAQIWLNWAVWSEPDSGYIGYVQATLDRRGNAEIAYVLAPSAWGRGFAGEAVTTMCAHLAEAYSVDALTATVAEDNMRSRRLLERMSFALTRTGDVGDDLVYVRHWRS
jgi:RimJ/RimL family protein N-acetyltransferase